MLQHKMFQAIVSLSVVFALSIGLMPLDGPVASRSSQAVQGEIIGKPQIGAAGVTETTAQIMQRKAAVPQSPHSAPRFRVDRSNLLDNRAAPAVDQWPTAVLPQRQVSPLGPQTVGISFTGATLADTGAFPPDTMGTVGPTQFIVAVNGRLRSFNKTTGIADGVLNTDMDTFFNSVMTPPTSNNFTSDPRIRYDRLTGRWFVIIIDVPGSAGALANRVLIAMSNTATITAGTTWTFFYFSPDASNFADYPTLGIDANALYIGANMFSFAGAFSYTSAFVVRKSSLTSGGPIVWTPFANLTGGSMGAGPYTPQGVDNYDPAATEGYFIGVDNATFSTLMIRRVSTPGGTPTISGNLSLTVPTTTFPNSVPHLGNTGGTNGNLDSLDDRLFAAHIRNGRLWTAHNIRVNSSGVASTAAGSRNAVRWYELQNLNATPSVVQSGTIFDSAATNPQHRWIPSIMVSGQGHVAVGYSNAGAASFANAATVGRLAGDTLGTMQTPVTYTASTFAYNPPSDPGGASGRRWGDFSYTSLDPCDDMTMWTIQEFTDATNSYGVRAVKLIAPPPATPSLAGPASVPQGSSAVTVTITGTVVNGSGFYDTPSNLTDACRQRLTAAVTGGVTINSVTYVSPTSVQLNISTVSASVGAQNVTITNPDGQSLTGVGLINVTGAVSYTLSTNTAGTGSGTISLNPPGGTYLAGTVVTLTAAANTGSSFASWSGAVSGSVNPITVTLDGNKSVTATFNLNTYTLSTGTAGTGTGTIGLNPPGGTYNYGTIVTVTATANTGSSFVSWNGAASGSTNPVTVTINGNTSITATFTLNTYTLSTSTAGNGSGSIGLNPPGGTYSYGTIVTVTATANTGSSFVSWSGAASGSVNPITVTLDSNKSVTATFNLNTYTLSTGTAGNGSGTIGLNPPGGAYNYGTVVTVTATPSISSTFTGWSGDISGSVNPVTITITGNKFITATFTVHYSIYLPIIVNNYVTLSDLIVETFRASRDVIMAVIENIGNSPAKYARWMNVYR